MHDQQSSTYAAIEKHFRDNHEQLVNRYKRYYQNNRERAEDVVSEGFVRALQYWETYNTEKPIDVWVNRIMNNAAKDIARQEATHGMLNYLEEDQHPGPIPGIMAGELRKVIETKKLQVRVVLEKFFYDGSVPKEIAREVPNMSPENVRKIVQRFRAEVKDTYKWEI